MDKTTIEFAQSKEKIAELLTNREHKEKNVKRLDADERSDYMRDYARVLYSSSFRRLQGKMQILPIEDGRFNRNRLTHSLEVSQIARSIAIALKLKDPVVAETCSLIHDIGNPPFGHYGEKILHEITSNEAGGYEGNAQAFRVVRSLEKKNPAFDGLNLTNRTLWGITKYFHNRESNPKKFLYNDDYDYLKEVLYSKEIKDIKSIDAQIMDLADEIAYAAHDLEDAMRAGLITTDELIYEFSQNKDYSDMTSNLKDIIREVKKFATAPGTLGGTSEEFSTVFKKELTSRVVNTLVNDISIVTNNDNEELGYKTLKHLADGLKKLVFSTILKKTKIQEYERHGEKVIRGLFEVYSDEKFNEGLIFLPPELRKFPKFTKQRLICDYISGMMDQFAIQEYIRFFGKSKYEALYLQKD